MAAMGKRRCAAVTSMQSARGYNTEILLQEYRAASSALPSYARLVTLYCGRTAELVKLRCSGTAFGESSHLTRAITGYIRCPRIASDMAP